MDNSSQKAIPSGLLRSPRRADTDRAAAWADDAGTLRMQGYLDPQADELVLWPAGQGFPVGLGRLLGLDAGAIPFTLEKNGTGNCTLVISACLPEAWRGDSRLAPILRGNERLHRLVGNFRLDYEDADTFGHPDEWQRPAEDPDDGATVVAFRRMA